MSDDKKDAKQPDSESVKPKETKIEINDFADEANAASEVAEEVKVEESEAADTTEESEPADGDQETAEAEKPVEKEPDTDEEKPAESEGETSEEATEEAEATDESETKAGPAGPYQPDMSMSVEEAIVASEAVETAAEDPEEEAHLAEIDAAVDDIVHSDSDDALKQADEELAAMAASTEKKSFKQKIAAGFAAWWGNKRLRYGTLAGLLVLFTALILIPTTRYGMLNLFGVRVSSSMIIVDSQTRLPLEGINVELQDKMQQSDEDGNVSFDGLKLGNSDLKITKRGYADDERTIVLGWGSNPIGEQGLVATGEQFTFVLNDWQSGNPVTSAEAVAGENIAKSDDSGKIILTVGQDDISSVEVTVSAEGYRDEVVSGAKLDQEEIQLQMVPGRKHAFVSNRSGQFDIYGIDVDGMNEALLLSATGQERDVPTLLPHPTRSFAALVSSRDGEQNGDGFVLDGLFILDEMTGDTKKITRSEQIRLVGWSGDNLIYWQVVEGKSAGNPERSKLISYNERTGESIDLASANYFNDVELVDGIVYYAVSSFAVPQSQAKLFSINVDGSDRQTRIDSQVWNIFRPEYNELLFSAVDQKWFRLDESGTIVETDRQNSVQSRQFVDLPDGSKTAWVDIRDGKGVLLVSDTDEIVEEQVVTLPGLNTALYWLNDDTLVFRVISNSETADYVINLTAGEALKVTDVTASQRNFFF